MLTILVTVMSIDYITGVLVAALGRSDKTEHGGLSSKVGFVGIARKGVVMLIVLLATMLDRAIGNTTLVFQSAATMYYIANEGLSILENASRIGISVPGFIRARLEDMQDSHDGDGGKDKPPDDDEEE